MMYDVVIIGAGLAGLSAGLRLSNEGKKVAIIEKHFVAGGYATNFKRKDKDNNYYLFDTALHGIGGLKENNPLNIILDKKLGILKNINILEKPETATILSLNSEEIDIPSNFDNYKELLIKKYPVEKVNVENLFDFLLKVKEDMVKVTEEDSRMPKYNRYLESITLDEFLREYTTNEELIEEFSFLWLYYGLPQKELNALYYILPWISYHIGGTFYIEGGAGKISNTFVEMIEANGSKVCLSSEVVRIDIYKDKITSVTTKRGNIFKGEKFIIACDPNHIFSMIEDNDEVIKYKEKLASLEKGISLTQLYIGLDCKSKDIGIEKGDYFIEVTKNAETYKAIKCGDYENMSYGVTSYDILDPNLNGEKQGVIAIVIGDTIDNWPEYKSEEYKKQKQIVTEKLLDKAEKVFPNLRKHIKVLELGTPHTMKRYTNNSGGAVYGWAQNVNQGGFNRLSFKTPFENTLLAGSWTNPGGGFEGAITSGVMCADRVFRNSEVKKESKEPTMDLNVFMAGMVANIDKKKAKGLDLVYHFNFDNNHDYYMEISKGKGRLLKEKPSKIDLSIMTKYSVWYGIAFEGKSGADALFDGDIRIEGPSELFMKIPELLDTDSLSKGETVTDSTNQKENITQHRKIDSLIWVNLALVPWIVYWILEAYVEPKILTMVATVYLVTFINCIKPRGNREISLLEGGTLIAFAVNLIIQSNYFMEFSLIFIFIISIIIKKPITAAYSKLEYSKEVVRTKLFYKVNVHLTALWVVVFALRFITMEIFSAPVNNIAYIFVIIGLILSYIYPRKKMHR
ncbi:MAG: FAD-dependent oxidoreductase [Clostridium sp.]